VATGSGLVIRRNLSNVVMYCGRKEGCKTGGWLENPEKWVIAPPPHTGAVFPCAAFLPVKVNDQDNQEWKLFAAPVDLSAASVSASLFIMGIQEPAVMIANDETDAKPIGALQARRAVAGVRGYRVFLPNPSSQQHRNFTCVRPSPNGAV